MKKRLQANFYATFLTLLLIIFSTLAVTVYATDAQQPPKTKERKVVATVNGSPLYEDQLEPGVQESLKKYKKYGMRKETPALINRLQKKTLSKVVDHELLYQESRKLTVKNLDEKVAEKLKKMKRKYQTDERFENHLKKNGQTIEGLTASIREGIYVEEYLKQQGIADPDIPDKNIREFYDGNPKSYFRKESIKVSHILIKLDENPGPEEKEKAFKKAQEIRKEIVAGADFAEMAKKHSECNSASGGGSLRYLNKGYMPEEFDKVAFTLEKDKVSDVVETKFGYHIILVTDKISEGITPYDEVKDFIKKFLQEDESKKLLDAHIAKLREKAKIEVFLEEPEKE
jgi:parvulin-like peptidyl-prolyl isomerase